MLSEITPGTSIITITPTSLHTRMIFHRDTQIAKSLLTPKKSQMEPLTPPYFHALQMRRLSMLPKSLLTLMLVFHHLLLLA